MQQQSVAGSQYSGVRPRQFAQNKPMKRPRFHPAAIIILVLSIGLVFVGLVMTIISVWPGYSPVGGNPLKIVGPVLLCVGLVVLIATIYYSCIYSKRRNQAMMNMSRSTLASTYPPSQYSNQMMTSSRQMLAPHTPNMSMEAKPNKGILKNSSSTSTYNGTAPSDTGVNRSRDSDISSGSGSVIGTGGKVNMQPDPGAGFKAQYSNGGYEGYDQHNVSGSLGNTSGISGSGAASQSLVGMGMLSPLALDSQPRTQQQSYVKPKGWGQTRSGPTINSRDYEHTQQQSAPVSSVSNTYRDMTRPNGYTTPQRPSASQAESSSTEV